MIKILERLIFITILSFCASFAVLAQKDDDRRTPPKGTPPVVVAKPKDPEKPKDDNRGNDDKKPRKPEAAGPSALQLVGIIFD